MKSQFFLAAALSALAMPQLALAQAEPAATAAAATATAKPMYGTWGVALDNRDTSVKPGDDFEKFASGTWINKTEIPADKAAMGSGNEVNDRVQDDLRAQLMGGLSTTKYGALYASFMDEARIEALGLTPLKADLAKVAAVKTRAQFSRLMGATNGQFGISLIDAEVGADTADPTMNVLYLGQGGIGLPEREYYLAAKFKPQRDAYAAYIARTMKAIGNPDPAGAAKAIMAFETAIATKSWIVADRRNIDKVNNPMSSAALAKYAPGIDWAQWFAGFGVPPQKRMIVGENTAVRDLARIYAATPLATLKLWQQFHIADQAAPYLTKAMVDSRFDYTKTLTGVTTLRPRWKRAVQLVDGSLGELVGQDYVKAHFPPQAKAKMESLVANLKLAMADRIRSNDWMSAPTKTAAMDKLTRMDVMVGYPDTFRSYDALKIDAGDLYGNVMRANRFNTDYAMADLGKKVDRKKWGMNPQTVNAYNGGLENKIVFPAGILQPPYFDMNADDAVNYGAIGAVIGHEITHGFDDQGRKIDATGAVRDWWTKEDAARFDAQAKIFGAQYAKFEAAPGAFINPELTMGENIADFAGLNVALDAYHKSLGGQAAPVIDGLTGDQRFFLAFAQAWRAKQRPDSLKNQVATDPHSPARFRVLGPLRNIQAWYDAFGVKPGDAMYIAPEQRAKIW
ncbi:M13 family metallopeptidase [Novosphingobium aquiterrae]|uniref:M13 family metallopeptidase n=1 Tax=Novosphingobium aquiterrae TaxID=624388 RepID=A0ABV6PFL6_9SPHN